MKKFLSVLLALAVAFTFTFGSTMSAFATSENALDSEAEFGKVVQEVKDGVAYNGAGIATELAGGGYLTSKVVNDAIDEAAETYIVAIRNASSNWDSAWAAVDSKTKFETVTAVFGYPSVAKMMDAQVKINEAAAKGEMAPDLSAYDDDDIIAINVVIDAQSTAIDTATTNYKNAIAATNDASTKIEAAKTAIDAYKVAVNTVKAKIKETPTASTAAEKLAAAKIKAVKALNEKSAAFIEDVKDTYATSVDATEVGKKASVEKDVAKLVEMYSEKIDEVIADKDLTNTAKITMVGTTIVEYIEATFAISSHNYSAFYADLTILNNADLLYTYTEEQAAAKKAAINNDGTKTYEDTDVDTALANAKKAVKDAAYAAVVRNGDAPTTTTVTAILNAVPEKSYVLASYKAAAIATFTTDNYSTATPTNTSWSYDRYDKVVAIQDAAIDAILVADNTTDIDALAKKAKDDIDAILTDAQISTLEDRADARFANAGYTNGKLSSYFDVVVGTDDYPTAVKTAAITAAKQVIRDAVVAKENKNITNVEIDEIVKTNTAAALAELAKAKTATALKAEAAAVDALINALPATVTTADKEQVLAAQKALEAYLDNFGTVKSDVKYATKLQTAVATIMNEEITAAYKLIKNLPATITVADAAAVTAARAAVDALETTYGNYDGYDKFGIATGFNYGYAAPSNIATLAAKEAALETAKIKDAADKIAALGPNPSTEAVAAARAAYDALELESKLIFNDELYAALLTAEKTSSVVWGEKEVKASLFDSSRKLTIWRTSKTSIKVTSVGSVADIKAHGYTVEYKFYKKNPGASSYKLIKTTSSNKYTYTNLKKGTNKFQVKVVVKDADGKLVATKMTYYRAAKVK